MMLVTQIHMGANMVADGTSLLVDAVDNGGFVSPNAYSAGDLALQVQKLRDAADKIEAVRAELLRNASPVRAVNQLIAAE